MAGSNSGSQNEQGALGDSWANISDTENSLDDELQSETTDAASLVDHTGSDDVRSLDERASDAECQNIPGEKDTPQVCHLDHHLERSTRIVGRRRVSLGRCYFHLTSPSAPGFVGANSETQFQEVSCRLANRHYQEACEFVPNAQRHDEYSEIVSRLYMTISKNALHLDRPFRVLYVGGASPRAKILAKIGDALGARSEPGRSRHQRESSLSHAALCSEESVLFSDTANRFPESPQIIVDDCITAAIIENDQAPDQIFLSLKDGSLCSSRWNGTDYEISTASGWLPPDLAVFFVTRNDHLVLKQRRQLVNAFVRRHNVTALFISEPFSWDSPIDDLPIDHRSPHVRLEAQSVDDFQGKLVLRHWPVDRHAFEALEPDQLNRFFAYICQRGETRATIHSLSPSSCAGDRIQENRIASLLSREKINGLVASCLKIWEPLWRNPEHRRTITMIATSLAIVMIGVVAMIVPLALIADIQSPGRVGTQTSPSTTWSNQSPFPLSTVGRTPVVTRTASTVVVPEDVSNSKGVATRFSSSDLMEVMTGDSVEAVNKSDNFQVHSIGDGHIIVKTPRGFKVGNKAAPFDVIVSRQNHVLDSSLAKLFEGVYSVRIDWTEAFGLLNVTVRPHKTATVEMTEVDFGAQWLKVAGWKKAAQIASEQMRIDVQIAREVFVSGYEQFLDDVNTRTREISEKAVRRAINFQKRGYLLFSITKNLLITKSTKAQTVTKHGRELAYKALCIQADNALETLLVSAHATSKYGNTSLENIFVAARKAVRDVQRQNRIFDFAETQTRMLEYVRSENLAKAQERAKQLWNDAYSSMRQWRASIDVSFATGEEKSKI